MTPRGEFEATTDPERGLFRGRQVARVLSSPDGMTVLVGKSAADNDIVTLRLARPFDFWFHVAAESGSHVVVLNSRKLARLPRATRDYAAGLAAGYSKARRGGRVAVHMASAGDVAKLRGLPPGKVTLRRFETVQARPVRADAE